ncbi:MAG: Uma2 family endonuclease [Pseudomonadota bacterium]|nr:Uma2 family endonuclease [Pseudomonadota bacterium]
MRHEYVIGQVYAMVGASRAHNTISLNLAKALRTHLCDGPYQTFMAVMKVRTENAFFYPDVVVICDPADAHEFYIERPALVAEVLSPSTEARDSLDKCIAYQSLVSLRDYVLIAHDRIEVCIYQRPEDGWELELCMRDDTAHLTSVGLEPSVRELYEGVLEF